MGFPLVVRLSNSVVNLSTWVREVMLAALQEPKMAIAEASHLYLAHYHVTGRRTIPRGSFGWDSVGFVDFLYFTILDGK